MLIYISYTYLRPIVYPLYEILIYPAPQKASLTIRIASPTKRIAS